MIYTLRNPKTGEIITVKVESEEDEKTLRMYVAVLGWEIVDTE